MASCLRDLELQDLPLLVDRSLTNKGLTDNRYALVSFAGSNHGQRPHIFTSGSQIFNDVTRMKTALDHLSNMPSDESVGDIFEALQFSARLNLRAGVVKTFVLVRCDASESMTSRAYGDSMTMLLEQGISHQTHFQNVRLQQGLCYYRQLLGQGSPTSIEGSQRPSQHSGSRIRWCCL